MMSVDHSSILADAGKLQVTLCCEHLLMMSRISDVYFPSHALHPYQLYIRVHRSKQHLNEIGL